MGACGIACADVATANAKAAAATNFIMFLLPSGSFVGNMIDRVCWEKQLLHQKAGLGGSSRDKTALYADVIDQGERRKPVCPKG
jgi:hypothetical protein